MGCQFGLLAIGCLVVESVIVVGRINGEVHRFLLVMRAFDAGKQDPSALVIAAHSGEPHGHDYLWVDGVESLAKLANCEPGRSFYLIHLNPKTFPVSSNNIHSPIATPANITAASLGARITDVSAMQAQVPNAASRIADQWVR
jgi:hypothetical protein